MTQTPKEKLLEKIISKLKENVTNSEEAMLPVNKKIHELTEIVHDVMKKNGNDQGTSGILSLILTGLENISDYYTHNMNIVTKNYNTYLYVLEALHNESGNSASEPAKIVKEVHSERDMPSQEPEPQLQPHQMSNELTVVTDERPKAKSELFKFP